MNSNPMKRWHKILTSIVLLCFAAWMALIHEPKTIRPERIQGFVSGPISEGKVPVELQGGEAITVTAPSQLPRIEWLRVFMEVTDYRWSGKRHYRITNWKSK